MTISKSTGSPKPRLQTSYNTTYHHKCPPHRPHTLYQTDREREREQKKTQLFAPCQPSHPTLQLGEPRTRWQPAFQRTTTHHPHAETPRCGVPAARELCLCLPMPSQHSVRPSPGCVGSALAPSPSAEITQHRARTHAHPEGTKRPVTASRGLAPLADRAAGRSSSGPVGVGRPCFLTQTRPGSRRSIRAGRLTAVVPPACRCAQALLMEHCGNASPHTNGLSSRAVSGVGDFNDALGRARPAAFFLGNGPGAGSSLTDAMQNRSRDGGARCSQTASSLPCAHLLRSLKHGSPLASCSADSSLPWQPTARGSRRRTRGQCQRTTKGLRGCTARTRSGVASRRQPTSATRASEPIRRRMSS